MEQYPEMRRAMEAALRAARAAGTEESTAKSGGESLGTLLPGVPWLTCKSSGPRREAGALVVA